MPDELKSVNLEPVSQVLDMTKEQEFIVIER
jgi:hypothetical protein